MKKCLWTLGLALLTGCADEQSVNTPIAADKIAITSEARVASEALSGSEEFFTEWLKSHGHADVVVDQRGVGVGNNATRLGASLYGSNRHDDGSYVVEVEFRVLLSPGREIVEFVAGMGESKQQAIDDALLNFTLTTFHVVYKAFINDEDPHIDSKQLEIEGQPRAVIAGDIYMRGESEKEPIDLNAMRPLIESALADLQLTAEPHWIKIVYSQNNNTPMTVSATLDNEEDPALTEDLKQLDWPHRSGFYMVKQFIVVGETAN